jgi:hypothetical protein
MAASMCHPEPGGVGHSAPAVVNRAFGVGLRARDLFAPNLVVGHHVLEENS